MTQAAAPARSHAPVAPALLSVESVAHRFGERVVLRDLSFSVARGEVFGLLGRNGAGKTTAFQVLLGLVSPQAGRFVLDGRPVRPGDRAVRARVGVVFQGTCLDQKLTARENLRLSAALHGLRGPDAEARVASLLERANLATRADEPVQKFSGGMRRRLEIARALVHGPALLVLDEPTSGLDEASFQRTWADLRARVAEGLSIVLTTHRPEEAARCDRLAVLEGGEIVAVDTPEGLCARVSGDVVTLHARDPEALAREVATKFSCAAEVRDGAVHLEAARGHELVPRLVEAFPTGRFDAVALRRPTLADAFLALTGHALASTREEP
jgi:ABC-2 type transport system ATP-binding protein